MITYETIIDALKEHYGVEEDSSVIEIFSQQCFDEKITDIAEALENKLNGELNV